jgi:hypothetical protein
MEKEKLYSELEILEFECEHRMNIDEIDELKSFVQNCCESKEDEEEPLDRIEELKEINEGLEQIIIEHYD